MKIFVGPEERDVLTTIRRIAIPGVYNACGQVGYLVITLNMLPDAHPRVYAEQTELVCPRGMQEEEWDDALLQPIIDGFYAKATLRGKLVGR